MRTKRGSIIAFSIILLSILLTSGLSVVAVAALEKQSSLSTQKSVVAFQAADSGIERVLKRIYIDNSPSTASIDLNDPMPDATLQQVATGLQGVTGASCNGGTNKIVATSSNEPAYTFEVSFFDGSDVQISCSDAAWRDKAVRLKTEGFYRQTSRVIELGIEPRPLCGAGDTVDDADGNTYNVIQIGEQCWMARNIQVGREIPSSTPQTNNAGDIEYYCYGNSSSNCTGNHPNRPDGGLYTWDEAMQYSSTERAQGICPSGWHIPSDTEVYTLENFLDPTINDPNSESGQGVNGGTKLKPGGTSGFELNLAGIGDLVGGFANRDLQANLWTSSIALSGDAWMHQVSSGFPGIDRGRVDRDRPASVRCIKD